VLAYAVTDFDVLVAAEKGSALSWLLPALIGLAAVVGLVHGRVLRATRPAVHARIGLGNEAFQLEKAASAAQPDDTPEVGGPAATRTPRKES
jgi:hypothetical protein